MKTVREDGQLLIQTSKEAAAALSTLPNSLLYVRLLLYI